MKTEKRIGYVDILNSEFRSSIKGTIKVGSGMAIDLEAMTLKVARKSLKEATEEVCVGQKGHIYEVILRRVE